MVTYLCRKKQLRWHDVATVFWCFLLNRQRNKQTKMLMSIFSYLFVFTFDAVDRSCLLVGLRPNNMQVYLREGSAQTILRVATLR